MGLGHTQCLRVARLVRCFLPPISSTWTVSPVNIMIIKDIVMMHITLNKLIIHKDV